MTNVNVERINFHFVKYLRQQSRQNQKIEYSREYERIGTGERGRENESNLMLHVREEIIHDILQAQAH